MDKGFHYQLAKPPAALADVVESFWLLKNKTGQKKDVIILPDGRIDLFISKSNTEPFHITLQGLGTTATQAPVEAGTCIFAISFNLLAGEYVLRQTLANLLDGTRKLPDNFWDFHEQDLNDFDGFCKKAAAQILKLKTEAPDPRKLKLFNLVYASQGAVKISELAEEAGWSSRQINRYFNQQYGLSLKTYCNILRFRASFRQIKEGKLFPEEHFADQAHFIKAIKKLSGAIPKELFKNKDDRFIQFSTLPPE